jgi:hypothetical protein
MSRSLALVYARTVIKSGYEPLKAIFPRRPALLLRMPDLVTAWTCDTLETFGDPLDGARMAGTCGGES